MRFLVVAYGKEPLDLAEVGDAAPRSHRYREGLEKKGKIIEHAHIAGHRAHAWVFDAESVDELDRILSDDPMNPFFEYSPLIVPLCSYERMEERERQIFGVAAEEQAGMAELEKQARPLTNQRGMRFLVIAYARGALDLNKLGDAPIRANRRREELMRQGKILTHGHIAGVKGHAWIYNVESVDELDELISEDPMSGTHQGDPLILPLCSYERMHAREERYFGKEQQDKE